MDRAEALEIVPRLVTAAQELADAAGLYRERSGIQSSQAFSEAVGEVVLAIHGLLQPIVAEHPDLHP
ncbi:hypothetical protein [Luteitalea sp.]